jgi:hypothetical protein
LFVDPVADIAVLGEPDCQDLYEAFEAYEDLLASMTPLSIADAPAQGEELIKLPYGDESMKCATPGYGTAQILSLDGGWFECAVKRWGMWLSVEDESLVKAGMSGSPIVCNGRAIWVISTGGHNPVLVDTLPARFLRELGEAAN